MTLSTLLFAALLQQAPTPVTGSTLVEWEHSGLDVQGNVEILSGFEVGVTTDGQDPNSGASVLQTRSMLNQPDRRVASLTDAIDQQPDGIYLLWVRAVDQSGNKSRWSGGLRVQIGESSGGDGDSTPPAPPANFRIRVEVGLRIRIHDNVVTALVESSTADVEE